MARGRRQRRQQQRNHGVREAHRRWHDANPDGTYERVAGVLRVRPQVPEKQTATTTGGTLGSKVDE